MIWLLYIWLLCGITAHGFAFGATMSRMDEVINEFNASYPDEDPMTEREYYWIALIKCGGLALLTGPIGLLLAYKDKGFRLI